MELSQQHITTIRHFFSGLLVKKAYLFGSCSGKEADENSDIDILVELDHCSPIGMQFFTYGDRLQDLLKKKVDVITYEDLSKYIKPVVDKEKVMIYEKLEAAETATSYSIHHSPVITHTHIPTTLSPFIVANPLNKAC